MEYEGKEIKTLKELEDLIVKDIDIRSLLDKLEKVPEEIKRLVGTQQDNLNKLRDLIELAEQLSDPTSKDNLLAVTKELYPAMATTIDEAEEILKRNKKKIVKVAKEKAMDGVELIKHIKSFYDNIIKVDIFGAEEDGRKIAEKLKKIFGNGNLTKGTKKLGRNLALSIVLAGLSSVILGYPIGSAEYFGITATGSALAGALTAKKSKERIANLINKLKKK